MRCSLTIRRESWPLAQVFRISRGARSMAHTILVELRDGGGAVGCAALPQAAAARESSTMAAIAAARTIFRLSIIPS